MGVVLVEEIHLLHIGLGRDEGSDRFHFHGGVGIKAEVPVVALAVRQVRVHGGVVEVDDFLAGVAGVVLGHGIHQRQRHGRAVALDDVARTLVDGGFQSVETFGRAQLVVNRRDFEVHTGRVALAAEFLGEEFVTLDLAHTHRPQQARQRIDANHLHGLTGLGKGCSSASHQRRGGNQLHSQFHS